MNQRSAAPPQLLISVRSAEEVSAALEGGADWIDLKEPSAGPLAAVDVRVAREAEAMLPGGPTLSAALGELRDWENSPAAELLGVAGLSVVKLGLAGCARRSNWQQEWLSVAAAAAHTGKQLAAVIYADSQQADAPAPAEIISFAQRAHCRYLLIDTFDKSAGSTFDHLLPDELEHMLRDASQTGMTTVVAGSMGVEQINLLPDEVVDIVAVRGAVCRGDRTGRIDVRLVEKFRQALAVRFGKSRISTSAAG